MLNQNDFEIIRSYIDQDKLLNIYLDYSLQTQGLDDKTANFVGAIDGLKLYGVLLITDTYKRQIGYLGHPVSNKKDVLLELLKCGQGIGVTRFIGEKSNFEPAKEKWPWKYRPRINALNFYKVRPGELVSNYDYQVRIATKSDIPLLVQLYKQYEYQKKNRSAYDVRVEIQNVMNASGKYFMAEITGKAVSAAKIGIETDIAGIVSSARTLPEYRGRGIYLSVRTAAYEYLFQKKKIGVGFFEDENQNMHKVLKKQGGTVVNTWLIINFGRKRSPARRRFIPRYFRRWILDIRDSVSRGGAKLSLAK
jgi:hypothetical protein